MIDYILTTRRWVKRAISISYDVTAIYLSFLAAWALRVGKVQYDYNYLDQISVTIAVCVSVFIFVRLGLYRAILRYLTQEAFVTIAIGATLSALVMAACSFMVGGNMPRSVPIIYGCIAFIAVGAPRIIFRSTLYWLNPRNKIPVIIYGAGETGSHLASTLQMGSEFHPVAIVDDNPMLQGTSIRGIAVESPSKLPILINKYKPSTLLLAHNQKNKEQLAKIIQSLGPLGIKIATVPKIADIVNGKSNITDIREIKISDLLGRETVAPITSLLKQNVSKKTVLITGAGGSIGSHICKEVLSHKPNTLILFDNSEYNLYRLNEDIQKLNGKSKTAIHCILGDIRNAKSIGDTIARFRPHTIYHAAAYKHVPMVEQNIWEGIRNNSYGTLVTAKEAQKYNVDNFVLISTDKAVRPTNVMGASKRMAELIIQALQRSPENNQTKFSAVRFGNVLDSSGSVIPKFREQIAQGEPLTVTHPEVTRYFMTIEEAAQLVIQAGAMSKGGDVFVLDMGEPVKIVDIAKEMIALSVTNGYKDNKAPEIEFVGLRPGEKLYEELLLNNQCAGTEHPRISIDVTNESQPASQETLRLLEAAICAKDIPAIEALVLSDLTGYQTANITAQNLNININNVIRFNEARKPN